MRVLFRADGGNQGIGLGHLMRCIGVAEVLKNRGVELLFVIKDDAVAKQLIQSHGHVVATIPSNATLEEDLTFTRAKSPECDWIIADSYSITTTYLDHLRTANNRVAYFDDFDRPCPVDLLIRLEKNSERRHCDILAGPAYLPLRSEYAHLPPHLISETIQRILIMSGGEDPANAIQKIVSALSHSSKQFILDIIIGAAYTRRAEIEDTLSHSPHHCHLHTNLRSVLQLQQQADLAITAGGLTVWELAAVGTPMMVLQTADNQQKQMQYIQKEDLAIFLGTSDDPKALETICGMVEKLEPRELRQRYSIRGQQLVDGKGTQRLADTLIQLRQQRILLKKVDPDPMSLDSQRIWQWRNDPVTRQMSRKIEEIPWKAHREWYQQTMQDEKKIILMGTYLGDPIGMIRFDLVDTEGAEVSINLSPQQRGKGLGSLLLQAACRYAHVEKQLKRLIANIRQENITSQKLFEHAGFMLMEEKNGWCLYQNHPIN